MRLSSSHGLCQFGLRVAQLETHSSQRFLALIKSFSDPAACVGQASSVFFALFEVGNYVLNSHGAARQDLRFSQIEDYNFRWPSCCSYNITRGDNDAVIHKDHRIGGGFFW